MASRCADCGGHLTPGARFCASCGAPATPVCAGCGADLPPEAAFCPACGAAQARGAAAAAGSEELRIVSCLFSDLAGFTAHTERSDPEDVRARLARYHREVRGTVERWGGRVEKLMGDGVFAVFGVPVVHEDDAERAVRAALRIQQSVAEINADEPGLDLAVRIGITTGEAIVLLEPEDHDERIVGDVVNTASRLQQLAPPGGVIVDERTHLAVRAAIECEALDPVRLRGKSAPAAVWQARQARSRYGVAVTEDEIAEFVGREQELRLLFDRLERAIAHCTPELVTISGEPGVGKSRLIREFGVRIDAHPGLVVRWRQGRSLPSSGGGTFAALAEIVKSEAGILESEPPRRAAAKLEASVGALVGARDDVDVAWLQQCLGPLAGTGGTEETDRTELFSAWLRYLELLAARHPLVLVFEDLHWADDALAEFLEYVLDWTSIAPILIVCTARPDWYARRPEWGGGKREAATIGLGPLTPEETDRLVGALTARSVMPSEVRRALIERSGGNPLYLIEYVRLAEERGWLAGGAAFDGRAVPDSIHAIVAARLDLLDPGDRSLLQAAAVVGRNFWPGALSHLRDAASSRVRDALHRLVRREWLRPVRRTSMRGEDEYVFTHVVARDVAYGQLTRSEKARLHRETGRWLEEAGGSTGLDTAELLAHHYLTALQLEPSDDPELRERALRFAMLAAERNESLDVRATARFALRAAEIAPDAVDRAAALIVAGRTQALSRSESHDLLTEAAGLYADAGDRVGEAAALSLRSRLEWWAGNRAGADADLAAAVALVEGAPADRSVVEILTHEASSFQLSGREGEALGAVEKALAAADEIGDTRGRARALRIRGSALIQQGDPTGQADIEEALRIDLETGDTRAAVADSNALASYLPLLGRPEEALAVIDEAIALGTQRGALVGVEWSKMTKCEALLPLGRIDEIDALAEEVLEADAARGGSQAGSFAQAWKTTVQWARGDAEGALRIAESVLEQARRIGDPQVVSPSLGGVIQYAAEAGEMEKAAHLAREFVDVAHPLYLVGGLHAVAPAFVELGMLDELLLLVDRTVTIDAEWPKAVLDAIRALVDETRGDPRSALDRLLAAVDVGDRLGLVFPATLIRLDAARCALALGERSLAAELLSEARAQAEAMGLDVALAWIEQVEAG